MRTDVHQNPMVDAAGIVTRKLDSFVKVELTGKVYPNTPPCTAAPKAASRLSTTASGSTYGKAMLADLRQCLIEICLEVLDRLEPDAQADETI